MTNVCNKVALFIPSSFASTLSGFWPLRGSI
ncbi:hypothetical protein V6Z11_A10G273700 [Gossypium hirsutum]